MTFNCNVHVHKSGKRAIQSWISVPQRWSMMFIHNAVKKCINVIGGIIKIMETLKFSHWLKNRCQFWQYIHVSSHVKFGIAYYHYYHICFYTLSVITGVVWFYMGEVKLHIHVIYILWLNLFYIFYSLYLLYPISFLSLSDNSSFGS